MAREEYSVETRAQIVALVMIAKMKPQDVAILLNIPRVSVYQIVQRAKEHGYDPTVNPRIEHEHVANNTRSGRPKVVTEAIEASIIASITKDRAGREKSAEYLAYEADKMKQARLAFALEHQHWTLEDFKNIIWTDETSVVLGHRRGSNRVWRRSFECYNSTVIRRRFKKACEFMFWGCFSYDAKGPYHIYQKENAAAKKKAEKELQIINRHREQAAREEWELNNTFSRLQLEILVPKLLPFAQECKRSRPGTIVMEDNAPAHAHFHQKEIYSFHDVQRLLWPGNSPDLNAVEPTWFWLKKRTTLQGAPGDRKTAVEAWQKAWERLPQHRIQAWIERIPFHIQEIIRLEGGNEYPEGRPQGDVRSRCRRKGVLSFRAYLEDEWEDLE
ncbi:hypothetical protein TMatcc_005818 [Talaromyces marneffei ATCC 18224]|uniref:Transposable element tc1 transposase, putative n=1 Tax=Talaromyces marneffei (strain ATCC 18224 / CBS 334.59 / QM 7333) TaxID=441960 RepID=B6Q8X8_TALMQ|nr:transposable element tc1 transposase, putative [Talaromyces marneffei ATCC 18224]